LPLQPGPAELPQQIDGDAGMNPQAGGIETLRKEGGEAGIPLSTCGIQAPEPHAPGQELLPLDHFPGQDERAVSCTNGAALAVRFSATARSGGVRIGRHAPVQAMLEIGAGRVKTTW
jgi:hypothetical protein